MKKIILTGVVLFTSGLASLYAQGVAISSTNGTPDPSAMLDVQSTDGGVLIPRLTQVERDAIGTPAQGLQIFNTTSGCLNMYVGTAWRQACYDCAFATPTAGNNSPVCEGSTLNLTANTIPGATYSWSGPNGFSSSDQNPVITDATLGASGIYSLSVTVDGCTAAPVFTSATVNDIPDTPTVSNDGPLCAGNTLNLSTATVVAAVYTWTGPNGFTSSAEDPQRTSMTTGDAGTYSLTVTVNGCESQAGTTNVVVNSIPAQPASIIGNTTVNSGSEPNQNYSVFPVPNADTYTWTVPSGWTIQSGQGGNALDVVVGDNSGDVTVTADNECGSSSPTSLSVTITSPKKVFVTSGTWTGDLGGLNGGDTKCQTAASAGSLSGTFKAWLSTGSSYAKNRLTHSSTGYKLVNGPVVASSWEDLTDGTIANPINRDEYGNVVSSGTTYVHTYTVYSGDGSDGTSGSPFYCNQWSTNSSSIFTRYGNLNSVDGNWSDTMWTYCNNSFRLYCFEQ